MSEITHKLIYDLEKCSLSDQYGRVLFSLHKNRLILRRYVDMPDELKMFIAEEYCKITNKNIADVVDFLNFKDEMFCS